MSETSEFIVSQEEAPYISFVRVPKLYRWAPKRDITPYEIALCLPAFATSPIYHELDLWIEALPEEARRHFELSE